MPVIEMVVAVAENGIIGKDGDMPWRLPYDLKHFKQVTMGCPIIMGRLTWESIGRPLPGRVNIVISRSALDLPDGVVGVATPEEALVAAGDAETVMIIGGGQIYKLFEPQAATIHLTEVHATPDGDTSFALQNPDDWHEAARERFSAGENDSADYSFITLKRI
ncbi:MAG: dihydrofolate reductase [Parvibaculales bacterium]